jgi:small subunit ribosomal protein S20
MPNHKSAEKRMRQNERRRVINRGNRTRLRTAVKNLRGALAGSDAKEMSSLLPETVSMIDKAVQKGVLHRNAAARHKSRLTRHVNQKTAK